MGFIDRPERKQVNPAKKWIEWNGKKGVFYYYDKTKEKQLELELPISFVVLEEYHTVGGYDNDDETGIYANEVLNIGDEEMLVKNYKGKKIATGIYKEIKENVVKSGGKYYKSIYAVMDGELINIKIKGGVVGSWTKFLEKSWNRLKDEFVTIKEVEDKKKGSIKYKLPIFNFGSSISDKDFKVISDIAQDFIKYREVLNGGKQEVKEPVNNKVDNGSDELDDLDF